MSLINQIFARSELIISVNRLMMNHWDSSALFISSSDNIFNYNNCGANASFLIHMLSVPDTLAIHPKNLTPIFVCDTLVLHYIYRAMIERWREITLLNSLWILNESKISSLTLLYVAVTCLLLNASWLYLAPKSVLFWT